MTPILCGMAVELLHGLTETFRHDITAVLLPAISSVHARLFWIEQLGHNVCENGSRR